MAEGSASALKRVVRSSFPVAENQHMRINWCSLSLDYERKPDRNFVPPPLIRPNLRVNSDYPQLSLAHPATQLMPKIKDRIKQTGLLFILILEPF